MHEEDLKNEELKNDNKILKRAFKLACGFIAMQTHKNAIDFEDYFLEQARCDWE